MTERKTDSDPPMAAGSGEGEEMPNNRVGLKLVVVDGAMLVNGRLVDRQLDRVKRTATIVRQASDAATLQEAFDLGVVAGSVDADATFYSDEVTYVRDSAVRRAPALSRTAG